MRRSVFRFLLGLMCVLPVCAEEITGDDSLLAPYLSSTTLLIARVDVARLNPDALKAWELAALKAMATDKRMLTDGTNAIDIQHKELTRWATAFAKCGGGPFYAVIDLSLLPNTPIVMIVPVRRPADGAKLRGVMQYGDDLPLSAQTKRSKYDDEARLIGDNVILWGDEKSIDAILKITPAARPSLLKTLAAAGAGTLQCAVEPTDELRQMAAAKLPAQLPPQLGGGLTADLLRTITGASLTLNLPPGAAFEATVHCASPDAASAVNTLATAGLAIMANAQAEHSKRAPELSRFGALLTPKLEGTELRIVRTGAEMDVQIAQPALLSMISAYRLSMSIQSMTHMSRILKAALAYADEHQGAFPDALTAAALGHYLGGEEEAKKLLSNPAHLGLDPAYVYVKPSNAPKNAGELVVMYEATDADSPDDRISVGFADGHCEMLTRAEFENLKTKGGAGGL